MCAVNDFGRCWVYKRGICDVGYRGVIAVHLKILVAPFLVCDCLKKATTLSANSLG
jgi:hypothetical protein